MRDALPEFYRDALQVEDLEAIAPPDIEVLEFESGSPLVFEATVDVRPEVELPDLAALNVPAPPTDVTDEDVNEQLDRLRDRFAELETVGREARRGDFVVIDLTGYRHDQPVEGASAPDYLYEVGSRTGPPKLDEELEGSRPGAILKFNDALPEGAGELAGQEISFTVLVKEVKAKRLPALDDDFAKTVGEFETLEELRSDLRERLRAVKRQLVDEEIRRLVLEALVDASRVEPPESLVEAEFRHRLEHFEDDLKKAGLTLDDYARHAQSTVLEVRSELRSGAARAVRGELLLEEVVKQQRIEVSDEDLAREIAVIAAQTQRDAKEVAQELATSGRFRSLAADIMRRKALDYVVQQANVVGRPSDEDVKQ